MSLKYVLYHVGQVTFQANTYIYTHMIHNEKHT
jgi:hypothetical protein